MNKTSISRIINDDAPEALPFSPLVWSGKGLTVLTEETYNLKRIQLELYKVHADLAESLRLVTGLHTDIQTTANLVNAVLAEHVMLTTILGELQSRVFPVLASLSNISVRTALTNANIQKSLVTISEVLGVVQTIRRGQLLSAVGKDVEVVVNGGSYLLTAKNNTGMLESGDGVVNVSYYPDNNHYEISGGVTNQADSLVPELGVSVVVSSDKKFATVSINSSLLEGVNGLVADFEPVGSIFKLRPSPNLLRAIPNSGLTVSQNSNGTFYIELKPIIQAAAKRKYIAGTGVLITGRTIAIDASLIPRFISDSPGVIVSRVALNPDVYRIDFDELAENLPIGLTNKLEVQTAMPLLKTYDAATNTYTFSIDKTAPSIDPALSGDINDRIRSLEIDALDLLERRKIAYEDLSSGFRQVYMNPLMKIFYFIIGDYEKSGLLGVLSSRQYSLLAKFGTRPSLIEVEEDILPYINMTGSGYKYVAGTEVEFDLYGALEARLKTITQDPSFKILDSERGTRYSLVEVIANDIEAVRYLDTDYQPLLVLDYNSAYNLEFLVAKSESSFVNTQLGTTSCDLVQISNFYSTKFNRMRLAVTGGDIDFLIGNAAYGQKNNTALAMPANFEEIDRIKLREFSESRSSTEVTFTMTIYDGYTDTDYTAVWKKRLQNSISASSDYMTEVSGNTNPGHVRAFARLFANWHYSDLDINRILFMLTENNKCLAKFASVFIDKGVIKQLLVAKNVTDQDLPYFTPVSKQAFVNYDTGMMKIRIEHGADLSPITLLPIKDILASVTVKAKFRVAGFGEFINADTLFESSCWGKVDEVDCSAVGVLPKPLLFTDPEMDFGVTI